MPRAEDIAHWKKHYATLSDEQVIAEKHQWIESSEMHIAAVQTLHERQQLAQEKALNLACQHHQESISQEERHHRKTQFVAWLAVIASVAGILFQIFYPAQNATSSTTSSKPEQQAPTASPTTSANSLPQEAMPQSVKKPAVRPTP